MTILNVRHTTVYRYRRPVRLGDHRLMLRPRDSHDLRLIRTNLNFSPGASVRWIHDVFGNSIAIATFTESAAELRIESKLQLETYAVERPRSEIAPEAAESPLAEIVPTWAISSFEVTFFEFFFRSATTASTARSMPCLRSIGFMPAATALAPSLTIA